MKNRDYCYYGNILGGGTQLVPRKTNIDHSCQKRDRESRKCISKVFLDWRGAREIDRERDRATFRSGSGRRHLLGERKRTSLYANNMCAKGRAMFRIAKLPRSGSFEGMSIRLRGGKVTTVSWPWGLVEYCLLTATTSSLRRVFWDPGLQNSGKVWRLRNVGLRSSYTEVNCLSSVDRVSVYTISCTRSWNYLGVV